MIQEDVNSWTHLNQAMIQFFTENRDRIPMLGMISNMVEDTLVLMRRQYDWLELFDALIFSCELGINKPHREIYEICLQQLAVNPDECLFVDDSVANVDGAVAVGMHGLQFRTFNRFLRDLDEKFVITS